MQDRANEEELERLRNQDRMLTMSMGGVMPEQAHAAGFPRVLDVGCGTGGWLIELAKTYPKMIRLVGVDVSQRMISFARAQASIQQVEDRVEFQVMDALRMLEFPASSFDLVNQRLGMSYLRAWDWDKLLQEYQRVCQRDGIVRITESTMIVESSSPALMQLNDLLLVAFQQAGHYFTPERDGVIGHLEALMQKHQFLDIQTHEHRLTFHSGTPEGQLFEQDIAHAYRTIEPYLRKWTRVPDDYQRIYQQALSEIRQPDFFATWQLLTAWGRCPVQGKPQDALERV